MRAMDNLKRQSAVDAVMRRVQLEIEQLGVSGIITPTAIEAGIEPGYLADNLVVRLRARLAAREWKQESETAFVPLTWWDHAKATLAQWCEQHRMGRIGKRLRVRNRPIVLVTKHVKMCPHLDLSRASRRRHIDFMTMDADPATEED